MELLNRDGMTYFVLAEDRDHKIRNVRRWEQAFRVFAAIYCRAFPQRSVEIWQYVYCINTAASSYHWDNVAYYDYTFRQLMAYKPHRSWAKTYLQGWNLAMRDPLNKQNSSSGGANSFSSGDKKSGKSWRDRCCWDFNRTGSCNKANCHFDNRCSYCGGFSHAAINCFKRKKSPQSTSKEQKNSTPPQHKNK